MADRTFESQALGAQLTQQAGQEVAAAAGNLGQGVAAGMESLNRRQQVAEERGDRNRQFDQNMTLENRKLAVDERQAGVMEKQGEQRLKQGEQQMSLHAQEIAQNREKFALEKVREERMARLDALRVAQEEIDLKKREREMMALSAISDDQLRQAEIERFKLENETAKLNLETLRRQAAGEPTQRDIMGWLNDPETQIAAGLRPNYATGKIETLSPEQQKQGQEMLSRRTVARTFETLIKSIGEFDPVGARKAAFLSMKVTNGSMTVEEAEKEMDKIQAAQGFQIGEDGSVSKAVDKAVGDTRLASIKEDGPVGPGNGPKVLAYFDQHADDIARWMGSAGDQKRQKKYSRDEAFREFSDAVSNPFNPVHGVVINALRSFDVIPPPQSQGGPMQQAQAQRDAQFVDDKLWGKK